MEKSIGGKAWSLVQVACVFYVGQQVLGGLVRKYSAALEAQKEKQKESDKVDLASDDSFPASDPPSYGGHTTAGPIH